MVLPLSPGVVFYNGYTFPDDTETVSVDVRPVYDQAGRTVVYNAYTFTFRWVLSVSPGTDSTLESLRKRLTTPAGEFHYEGCGLGNLAVNVPAGGATVGSAGAVKDVVWGPKPEQ